MNFTLLDWSAIVLYLGITLMLGLYFRSRSGKSVDDYFVSGRNVSWWLAGTSMVATTFAADTPLVVTGLVYTQGIAGNWLWWAFLLSGMMTVFLFARLWRRSGLLTDVQFAEMRYSGKPAAFLRGFRAIYLGLLMNCLILGWVTKAMTSIVSVTLGVSDRTALAICVLFLIPFTGLYVALGGLWGVLWTDLFQFALKMAIVIGVAWYAVSAAGGMHTLLSRLAEMRVAAGPNAGDATAFFPGFLPSIFAGRIVASAGNHVCGEHRIAVVGLLVSGSGAGRRRLHRTTHLQRQGRAQRPAFRALVQRGALCAASVALDSYRAWRRWCCIRISNIPKPDTC